MIMHNPAHAGEVLNESYIKPYGLSITEAAKRLGVTRKALSELINTKSGVSIEMAYKLAVATKTTPDFWINLQSQYDLWHGRETDTTHVVPFAEKETRVSAS